MNRNQLHSISLKVAPVIIWGVLIMVPLLLPFGDTSHNLPRAAVYNILLSNTVSLVLFYIHTFLLYPLIRKKKTVWYLLLLALLLAAYALYSYISFHFSELAHSVDMPGKQGFLEHGNEKTHFTERLLSPVLIIILSFCYRIILDQAVREQQMKERETVHLRTELGFLRSQISPHFIFNVLNSLVALNRKNSADLEPAIVNLSNLMRYMLYETNGNPVPLSKEVEYLKSYVDLQKLRFGSFINVDFHITGSTDSFTIEPMLLIPFVENAFKHGIGGDDLADILIDISTNKIPGNLRFSVTNPIGDPHEPNSESGIGLINVKRRLSILYPDRHSLEIFNDHKSFSILLTIAMN